jgi:hypothetical protein
MMIVTVAGNLNSDIIQGAAKRPPPFQKAVTNK